MTWEHEREWVNRHFETKAQVQCQNQNFGSGLASQILSHGRYVCTANSSRKAEHCALCASSALDPLLEKKTLFDYAKLGGARRCVEVRDGQVCLHGRLTANPVRASERVDRSKTTREAQRVLEALICKASLDGPNKLERPERVWMSIEKMDYRCSEMFSEITSESGNRTRCAQTPRRVWKSNARWGGGGGGPN